MSDDGQHDRTTSRERFAPLHQGAADLVAGLEREFDVLVEEVKPGREHANEVLSATRISPANGGAPVVVTLTGFPGLVVRFGERSIEWYPPCGCEDCQDREQPEYLLDDLRHLLWAVAGGRFRESPNGWEFRFEDGGFAARGDLSAPVSDYPAWPLRGES